MRHRKLLLSIWSISITLVLFVGSSNADVLTKQDRPQSCYPPMASQGQGAAPAAPGPAVSGMRLCLTSVAAARVGQPLAMRLTLENVDRSPRVLQRFPTETRLKFEVTDSQGRVVKPWFYPIRTTISGNLRYGPTAATPLSFPFSVLWSDAPPGTYNVQACWRLGDLAQKREIEPCSNVVAVRIMP